MTIKLMVEMPEKRKLQIGAAIGLSALYIGAVLCLTFWSTLEAVALFPLFFVVSYCALSALCEKASACTRPFCEERARVFPLGFFFATFLIVFAGQLMYWFAYYPGGFNLDAYGQWDQVHGRMGLNNWHPVFTTACYWLITRVYDNFAFCIFTQLLLFSLSASYLLSVLRELGIPKTALVLAAIYIALNPAIGMNNICLFKDVPFTIALIWMTVILIRVVATDGKWLDSFSNLASLLIALVAVSLIRHNGIFFIAPALLCLIVLYKAQVKKVLAVLFALIVSLAVIQGPFYSILSVDRHNNPVGEMVGIPMAIMANNLVSDPDNVPEDVRFFLLEIAEEEDWEKEYILGEWDSCKWDFGGIELLQDESLMRVLELSVSSVVASPEAAFQSVRENTRVVWQVVGDVEWDTWVYVEENVYGIAQSPNALCASIVEAILSFSLTPVGAFLCWNIGVVNVLLVVLGLISVVRNEYPRLILLLPILSFNFLTMLLLCGPSHRYFYYSSVLVIPLALFMLYVSPAGSQERRSCLPGSQD